MSTPPKRRPLRYRGFDLSLSERPRLAFVVIAGLIVFATCLAFDFVVLATNGKHRGPVEWSGIAFLVLMAALAFRGAWRIWQSKR